MTNSSIHPSASVSPSSVVAHTAVIWHNAQIRELATVGERCVIGAGVYVGVGVPIGDDTKIQNYALIYEPASIGPGVFVGPGVVLTNDRNPRAINVDGSQKVAADWKPVGVIVEHGASIGARSVCIAPIKVGKWAMIGAGSVVTKDVPDFAVVAGNPARQIGWVGEAGEMLKNVHDNVFCCPKSGRIYKLIDGVMEAAST